MKFLVNFLPENSIIITTTGIISREVYDILKLTKKKMKHFMCVGGMGHAVSIATGIAQNSNKKVYCLDGDGSIGMHMGSLSVSSKQKNLIHILLNNFSHESVGGHDTATKDLNFSRLAKVIGYGFSKKCTNINSLKKIMLSLKKKTKSSFIEILCSKGHRKNVSRPKENLIYLKEQFKKNL